MQLKFWVRKKCLLAHSSLLGDNLGKDIIGQLGNNISLQLNPQSLLGLGDLVNAGLGGGVHTSLLGSQLGVTSGGGLLLGLLHSSAGVLLGGVQKGLSLLSQLGDLGIVGGTQASLGLQLSGTGIQDLTNGGEDSLLSEHHQQQELDHLDGHGGVEIEQLTSGIGITGHDGVDTKGGNHELHGSGNTTGNQFADGLLQTGLKTLQLATKGKVNTLGARLAVLQGETGQQSAVNLGLDLDVLTLGHGVQLVGNQAQLLLSERGGSSDGGNLGAGDIVVDAIESNNDVGQEFDALLVVQEVQEILGNGRSVDIIADLLNHLFCLLLRDDGVGEEIAEARVGDDGTEILQISVQLIQRLGLLAELDQSLGVVASNLTGITGAGHHSPLPTNEVHVQRSQRGSLLLHGSHGSNDTHGDGGEGSQRSPVHGGRLGGVDVLHLVSGLGLVVGRSGGDNTGTCNSRADHRLVDGLGGHGGGRSNNGGGIQRGGGGLGNGQSGDGGDGGNAGNDLRGPRGLLGSNEGLLHFG
mmetsp:Transcript_147375/g.257599  ORF Transcript_147375/g.257599 Transcript_147375/m.257599 type:complete len:524 (+) Transcript_147375:718-2289(+)